MSTERWLPYSENQACLMPMPIGSGTHWQQSFWDVGLALRMSRIFSATLRPSYASTMRSGPPHVRRGSTTSWRKCTLKRTGQSAINLCASSKMGTIRAHSRGVNPSVETVCDWHTCRSLDFATQITSSCSHYPRLAKQRRALVETNPPRNNQPETHRDDEPGRRFRPSPCFRKSLHRIERSPYA